MIQGKLSSWQLPVDIFVFLFIFSFGHVVQADPVIADTDGDSPIKLASRTPEIHSLFARVKTRNSSFSLGYIGQQGLSLRKYGGEVREKVEGQQFTGCMGQKIPTMSECISSL